MKPYQKLDPIQINATMEMLYSRICERFPDSGLSKVCRELVDIGKISQERVRSIAKANCLIRIFILVIIFLLLATLIAIFVKLNLPFAKISFPDFIQVCDSALNVVVLLGASLFFLITMENRIKRNRIMKAVHELRVLIHIIDMHQLTKDPEWVLPGGKETASSPKRKMTPFELSRYLDYCSEMLSLIGNIATLYVQDFDDPAAVTAVNGIDVLTVGISRKIWQKLMILHGQKRTNVS